MGVSRLGDPASILRALRMQLHVEERRPKLFTGQKGTAQTEYGVSRAVSSANVTMCVRLTLHEYLIVTMDGSFVGELSLLLSSTGRFEIGSTASIHLGSVGVTFHTTLT